MLSDDSSSIRLIVSPRLFSLLVLYDIVLDNFPRISIYRWTSIRESISRYKRILTNRKCRSRIIMRETTIMNFISKSKDGIWMISQSSAILYRIEFSMLKLFELPIPILVSEKILALLTSFFLQTYSFLTRISTKNSEESTKIVSDYIRRL